MQCPASPRSVILPCKAYINSLLSTIFGKCLHLLKSLFNHHNSFCWRNLNVFKSVFSCFALLVLAKVWIRVSAPAFEKTEHPWMCGRVPVSPCADAPEFPWPTAEPAQRQGSSLTNVWWWSPTAGAGTMEDHPDLLQTCFWNVEQFLEAAPSMPAVIRGGTEIPSKLHFFKHCLFLYMNSVVFVKIN